MKNSILNRLFSLLLPLQLPLPLRLRLFSLPLLLLLSLFLTGCSLSLFPGYRPCSSTPASEPASWFTADSGHFLFNSSIDIYKKHFSGLMVVKPMPEDNYRVVFLTEVGIKVFDLEFSADSAAKVHYMMEAMNRKALVNTLSRDISLVLMNPKPGATPECLRQKKSDDLVYLYREQGRKNYYFVRSASDNPYLAKQTGCMTNKLKARLYGNSASGLDSVLIRHENIRLSLNLYRIKE